MWDVHLAKKRKKKTTRLASGVKLLKDMLLSCHHTICSNANLSVHEQNRDDLYEGVTLQGHIRTHTFLLQPFSIQAVFCIAV
jgi:hypothetical protein